MFAGGWLFNSGSSRAASSLSGGSSVVADRSEDAHEVVAVKVGDEVGDDADDGQRLVEAGYGRGKSTNSW